MDNLTAQEVSAPFTIPVQGSINCIAVQTNGAILVAGSFQSIGDLRRTNIARFHADGTPDLSFDAGALFAVGNLLLQEDGKIVVSDSGSHNLLRLLPEGSTDPEFRAVIGEGAIRAMNLDLNGRILLAGQNFPGPLPWTTAGLVRLLPDGSQDPSLPRRHDSFTDVAITPEEVMLAVASYQSEVFRYTEGGQFTPVGMEGVPIYYRLLAQGMLADTFKPIPGRFLTVVPQSNLEAMATGEFSIPGALAFVGSGLHRLRADGTPDGFTLLPEYDQIDNAALALQLDGNIILAGRFSEKGTNVTYLKRIQNPQPGVRTLLFSASEISWTCAGSTSAFSQTTFERSTNGIDWAFLGRGKRLNGTWTLDTAVSTGDFVRVRGFVTAMNLGVYNRTSMYWQDDQAEVGAPVILQQPQSRTCVAGGTVELGISVAGIAPISYTWYKDGLPIAMATNASLLLSPVKDSDAGQYSVIVSNSLGMMPSQPCELVVTLTPQLKSELLGYTAGVGSNVVFHAEAAGSQPITYQWAKDGTNIPGATNSTLLIEAASLKDQGAYRLLVSNPYGTRLSAPARLLVGPPPQIGFTNGQLTIRYSNFGRVIVEVSTDLRNWTPIRTFGIGVGGAGVGSWADFSGATQRMFFYRARAD